MVPVGNHVEPFPIKRYRKLKLSEAVLIDRNFSN